MAANGRDRSDDRPLPLSPLVLGGGVFSAAYSDQEYLTSNLPEQVIELAFANGINAIDTSPFYGVSEVTIGSALRSPAISSRFPRESYHLITKCGRYGANRWSFDYSPERIFASVKASIERMQTTYLDAVYLHDVEFVADEVGKANHAGYPLEALKIPQEYGLAEVSAGRIAGKGDQAILDAYGALLELKKQGLIRKAGIAGYPLPTLLRLARLIKHHHHAPVDMLQTYSHYNLQTSTLEAYLPLFREAGIGIVLNASPLNMGLLSTQGAHFWHLAPNSLKAACKSAAEQLISDKDTTLQAVALGYGLKSSTFPGCHTVVGCNTPAHVHELLATWNTLYAPGISAKERDMAAEKQQAGEEFVWNLLRPTGYLEWSWQSPPPFVEEERTGL